MDARISRKQLLAGSALSAVALATPALSASADIADDSSVDIRVELDTILDRLWVLEAKERIRYKLALYPRGLDRQDTSIGHQVFTDDSYIDYGTAPDGSWQWQGSGPEWIEYCTNTIDKGITASGGYYDHEIFQVCITVNGSKAGSEYYGTAYTMNASDGGSWTLSSSVARYCDKWEYRDDDWYIVERIVTNDFGWSIPGVSLREPYGCAFDASDPSYAALAWGEGAE